MSVILKVDEKVKTVIEDLSGNCTDDNFLARFKEMYPADYERCWKRFRAEEQKTKPGTPHPMQHPDRHVVNALHSYLSRKVKANNSKNNTNED